MSYLKNKRNRLKNKYTNILMKDFGIEMSNSPTKMIVICNGGLANGITHEMVCQVFGDFENMDGAFMVPGKSYAFVTFQDEISAEKAFSQTNEKLIWSKIKGPVNLGYVNNFNVAVLQQSVIFKNPPGLILLEDFISPEEEKSLLKLVGFASDFHDGIPGENGSSKLKHRKVKHYGFEFKYTNNNVDLNDPIEKIPDEMNFLWKRLKDSDCQIDFKPDQLTVNVYEQGQGIPPHVDTHSPFEDGIYSLSLLSPVIMEFKNHNGLVYSVLLKRRSLCIMLKESRYDWMHCITPRKSDLVPNDSGDLTIQTREKRVSFTFRKTRTGDCTCKYPRLCDTALRNRSDESIETNVRLENKAASELECNYVHGVYDKISDHFSETRRKPWPNVVKFVDSFPPGSILLDVGCGNGKYFSRQNVRYEIGCDSSVGLVKVCRERGFESFCCNCLNIPLRDESADGCICIAVIHHLSTEDRRTRAIEEMMRVLRKRGRALIYVWAKNQEIRGEKSSYLKRKREINSTTETMANDRNNLEMISLNNLEKKIALPVHSNRTNFRHNDLLVPWKLKKKGSERGKENEEDSVYLRFYHVYEDDELRNACLKLKNVAILDYYYDQGNWCVVLEKI